MLQQRSPTVRSVAARLGEVCSGPEPRRLGDVLVQRRLAVLAQS